MNYTFKYLGDADDFRVRGYIFVLGHMRSLSSLLCHILGSNAEVAGYAEMHLSYHGERDLRRLVRSVGETIGTPVVGKWVLDKVLHNHDEIAPEVLDRADVRILFLLRNPAKALQSILGMTRDLKVANVPNDPVAVLRYYCERLRYLERLSLRLNKRAAFIDSDRLITATDVVLERLSEWLGLAERLNPTYRSFKYTGRGGYGDTSGLIRSGTVVRDSTVARTDCAVVPIPATVHAPALEAWSACREILMARCEVL
ncbi:MAG: sulfotransferase domain-containing protein [Aromatoleum sp.]|nr:sulfotransferase domain-containing protein [Aromatoleum sp.]